MSRPRYLLRGVAALIALLAVVQLVPYGRSHDNPRPGASLAWDSGRTQDLARRACFDCHSHETRWPWYASVAPVSWRIAAHVNEGRRELNFSAFDPANEKMVEHATEAGETVTRGTMPPRDYLLLHPEARLTDDDKAALAAGLDRTFEAVSPRPSEAEESEH